MNILITGGTGFVGSHMIDYILDNEIDVRIYATKRWMEDTKNLDHIDDERFQFIDCDLIDGMSVQRAIEISKPNKVFHFAAQSFPEVSFKIPVITLQTNVIGTTHLFESIKDSRYNPTIVSISSSEVYGNPNEDEIPITEDNPIRPANPYSISKVGHDLMSQYYHKAYGMKIITTRMFSHEGARRGKQFALSSFAYQIVQNEKLIKNDCQIRHGNLDSVRTYNHIEDAIKAYWLCSESNRYGEVYNIGGDYTCTVGEALDMLISKSKISDALTKLLDKKRVRPTDITLQIPSSDKFREHFGWKPEKDLTHICDDLLDYWREVL
jgi:GDP-mannose 4,6-dehydratase